MLYDPIRIAVLALALLAFAVGIAMVPDPLSFSLGTAFGLLAFLAYLMVSLRG